MPVTLAVHGEHQVGNSLAAAAVALELGMPLPAVADALGRARALSRWRMEVTERPDGVLVVNDAYNANPESMAAALRALATMARGRRSWAVLGEMAELGAAAADEHRRVGELAAELGVDRVVVVGPGGATDATPPRVKELCTSTTRTRPSRCCGRSCARRTWCW